jgi:hypothetical protein
MGELNRCTEIPNPNIQAPNNFQFPNSKYIIVRVIWILIIGAYLGFGAWCLEFKKIQWISQ